MRMWFGHFPPLFDQLDGLQPTVIKLWGDKSHDGIAEDFRMLNLFHPGGSSGMLCWPHQCCNHPGNVCRVVRPWSSSSVDYSPVLLYLAPLEDTTARSGHGNPSLP